MNIHSNIRDFSLCMAVDALSEYLKFIQNGNPRPITDQSKTLRLLPKKTANLLSSHPKKIKAEFDTFLVILFLSLLSSTCSQDMLQWFQHFFLQTSLKPR